MEIAYFMLWNKVLQMNRQRTLSLKHTSVGQMTERTPLNAFFVKDLSSMLPTMHYKETKRRNVMISRYACQSKVNKKCKYISWGYIHLLPFPVSTLLHFLV
jgi:hypothetical protein